jgi:propionyl-CoA synthetase
VFVAGERADPPTVDFFTSRLNKPVIDHWWQTETGSAITALPIGLLPQPAILDQGKRPSTVSILMCVDTCVYVYEYQHVLRETTTCENSCKYMYI